MTLTQVRSEYGSFREAVQHYAAMGCSRRMTARYLGFDRTHFRQLVRRFDLDGLFPQSRSEMLPECRGVGHPARAEANRRRAAPRITAEELLPWVRQCRTAREFQRDAPYSLWVVIARFGSWRDARAVARRTLK
jgi:hypothetical protein